jgi:hypothetical protein
MTPEQLAAQCPRGCGRTVGEHKLPYHKDDCTWRAEATSITYDRAEDRYHAGLWSLDQWEAFQRLHQASKDKLSWRVQPITSGVEHYINLIENGVGQ